ncbi:DEAD/DEAH box helicase [Spartinivicinus ruber]|uniref:DEAD/DEAH box helicase n=1 Tax=Spartinivicinus ruber TaxID=2683272 RepID=UPI0013D3BD2E|nr:type ISP restriction/modification enzyme [Spartinivicinus ruber]
MGSALNRLLETYRSHAKTPRELGSYFESISKAYLENDDIQRQLYSKIWRYADWAAEQGLSKADTGIDLVAQMADDAGLCAIQCKFYDKDYRLQRKDLDSFFSASGKKPFSRRIVIDTTLGDLGKNAQSAFEGQQIETLRIGLSALEESRIDWLTFVSDDEVRLCPKKQILPHQKEALKAVKAGLATTSRGKLIMACGTGKTFTGLKIAENLAGLGKRVLFLVPSLSLMSQTVTKWTNDTVLALRSFAVCSDTQVGKRRKEDVADLEKQDLVFPATTHAETLAKKASSDAPDKMTVVFSTYQSIQAISDAQLLYGLPEFDLIICDEAHRTTGATLMGEAESSFVKVHNQDFIQGKKRLYMTATPRIFGDAAKVKANEAAAVLCSMDDTALFGEKLFELTFSQAVQTNLLSDYKVVVLAVDEGLVSQNVQRRLASEDNELKLDDATKIIGCYKALAKKNLASDIEDDVQPMRRALAFCRDIKSSKLIESEFGKVVEEYLNHHPDQVQDLRCGVRHVDGTFNTKARNQQLEWLKENTEKQEARLLTNARCLSEGVDVPELDAIIFMHPRKSQIDVVQSVGRVMRKAEGKEMGYVILPVGIPAGVEPEEALNNNEKYEVIWQILNALRAHDDRFDAMINKAGLGEDVSSNIQIVGISSEESTATTAVVQELPSRNQQEEKRINIGGSNHYETEGDGKSVVDVRGPQQFSFIFDELSKAVMAKIVKKCGTRLYWEDWAKDIAKIAQAHVTRIATVVEQLGTKERNAFEKLLEELRDDLNDSITEAEAIEMLAQHLITKPVFDVLFEGHSFTQENPVSKAIQGVLDVLEEQHLEKESQSLKKFYDSVKQRAQGVETIQGKQHLVVELYNKFFRKAFPLMANRLGIVYTPVEVVDFIIHSVNDVLKDEFGLTLGSKGVHILDPFTGTGTFITRLMQSGLITLEELVYKYTHEIHANEIVLLAYYIAAINIEAVYHDLSAGEYVPFKGICLTDTFHMHEKEDLISHLMADNSGRRKRQKKLDIKVIMSNPPYSSGQKRQNDNNSNIPYHELDESIRSTYAQKSRSGLHKYLYDSYIRAIRWGSDRLGKSGVMAYVSGNAWIERSFADGMRKCLANEFTKIYVFNLRGDIRKNMLSKGRAKEGSNIFGSSSMTGIVITLLIKNPNATSFGNIFYYDIGEDLNSKEKLALISSFVSINGITEKKAWRTITPDDYGDWLNQRDKSFDEFISLGDKKNKTTATVFENYSLGVVTNRDAWCYNASKSELSRNISRMINYYNSEVDRYLAETLGQKQIKIDDFVHSDAKKISWSRSLKGDLKKRKLLEFQAECLVQSSYRPFSKQWVYFNRQLNEMVCQIPQIFPKAEIDNRVIIVTGVGARSGFSVLMINTLPNLHTMDTGQCFPLKLYEPVKKNATIDLVSKESSLLDEYTMRDGISDAGLSHFQIAYPGEKIRKEDIFYYLYGLLHSEDYYNRYANNISKQLPRIPCVKKAENFWAFAKAGKALAELHVNYETVEPYPVEYKGGRLLWDELTKDDFCVDKKWKFGGTSSKKDKSTVIYNHKITMTNIPVEAYDYIVNGKPALEWVMERQVVKKDKSSGIVNDANRYAIETMKDPSYPLKLFQRIITVSLQTLRIVKNLPRLDIN